MSRPLEERLHDTLFEARQQLLEPIQWKFSPAMLRQLEATLFGVFRAADCGPLRCKFRGLPVDETGDHPHLVALRGEDAVRVLISLEPEDLL